MLLGRAGETTVLWQKVFCIIKSIEILNLQKRGKFGVHSLLAHSSIHSKHSSSYPVKMNPHYLIMFIKP